MIEQVTIYPADGRRNYNRILINLSHRTMRVKNHTPGSGEIQYVYDGHAIPFDTGDIPVRGSALNHLMEEVKDLAAVLCDGAAPRYYGKYHGETASHVTRAARDACVEIAYRLQRLALETRDAALDRESEAGLRRDQERLYSQVLGPVNR